MKNSSSPLSSADAQKHPVTLYLSAEEHAALTRLTAVTGVAPAVCARAFFLAGVERVATVGFAEVFAAMAAGSVTHD